MAKVTRLNIDISDVPMAGGTITSNHTLRQSRNFYTLFQLIDFLHELGWEMVGSGGGDGTSLVAVEGMTAPVPPEDQGQYGQWDVFKLGYNVDVGGYYRRNAWVIMREPPGGSGRMWSFRAYDNTSTAYLYIVARVGRSLTGSASPTSEPSFGSTLGSTQYFAGTSTLDIKYLHLVGYDDPENGVYMWHAVMVHEGNNVWHWGQFPIELDAPHNELEGDPAVYWAPQMTRTIDRYGTPSETNFNAWPYTGGSPNNSPTVNYWKGGSLVDPRDNKGRISKIPIYVGSGAQRYLKGYIGRGVRMMAQGGLEYPVLLKDQHDKIWLCGGTFQSNTRGIVFEWDDQDPPVEPLVP